MTLFLDVFGFLSVILRGLALAFEALVVGGAVFLVWIARPDDLAQDTGLVFVRRRCSALLRGSAIGLLATQICYVTINSILLMGTSDLRWRDLIGANYFLAGVVVILVSAMFIALTRRAGRWFTAAAIPLSLVLISASVATSHAASRIDNSLQLMLLTSIHHAAVGAWVGGLGYLVLALGRSPGIELGQRIAGRYSRAAQVCVVVLLFAGVGLSWSYLHSFHDLYGTNYGLMVLTKVLAFGILLGIGGLNYFIVRRVQTDPGSLLRRLSRFAEAEVGIGFTIILATASLTSMPPAVDLRDSRATAADIAQRFSPALPRLKSPEVAELTLASPLDMDAKGAAGLAPESFVPGQVKQANTASDIAWSEYNHNWSGLVVLTAGLLAVAARTNRIRLARHWPLVFIGLGVFLFLRADPENWPLGPHGFWESMVVAEVLQHRLFVFLIVSFAIFEWKVQTGRISPARAGLVFPAVCAIGGALLLTHTHSLGNSKDQLLIEMSHAPLALLGIVAGWSRWLELRSAGPYVRVFSWIWPICLTLVGAILVNYREI